MKASADSELGMVSADDGESVCWIEGTHVLLHTLQIDIIMQIGKRDRVGCLKQTLIYPEENGLPEKGRLG